MEQEPKKKKFFSMSLESWVTVIVVVCSGVGVYTQLYADVNQSKAEIANLKQNQIKNEIIEKEARQEMKQDVRDVKSDVKELNNKVDRVLQELMRAKNDTQSRR